MLPTKPKFDSVLHPVSRTKNSHIPPTSRLPLTPCDPASPLQISFHLHVSRQCEKVHRLILPTYENGRPSPISETTPEIRSRAFRPHARLHYKGKKPTVH